jgi:hypothetical protein
MVGTAKKRAMAPSDGRRDGAGRLGILPLAIITIVVIVLCAGGCPFGYVQHQNRK